MHTPIEQSALSIADAAKVLGMTEAAIRGRLSRKQLPYIKYYGRVFILKSTIDRILLTGDERSLSAPPRV